MRIRQTIWAGLALSALAAPAAADSFGPWSFSMPDDYELTITAGRITYKGPNATITYHNAVSTGGEAPADIGPSLIEDVLGAPPSFQQMITAENLDDGRNFAMFIAQVDGELHLVGIFVDGKQAGLVTMTPPDTENLPDETQTIMETEFYESEFAEPLQPSRLPEMAFPEPLTEPVARTRAEMTVQAAIAQGINPGERPLPVRFQCYRDGTQRPMTATPDLEFTFADDGTYRVSNGQRMGGGKWHVAPNDTFDTVVKVDGTMAFEDYFIVWATDGNGQAFSIDDPYSDGEVELTCHQEGPRVERVQQIMARVVLERGLLECTDADGAPFRLMYGDGVYKAPQGTGRMTLNLDGDGDEYWKAVFNFQTGPYALFEGEMDADENGALTLEIDSVIRSGSMFYSSTETTRQATCMGFAPQRILPLYGQDPAPPASVPKGGLPEGLYHSLENYSNWSGTMYTYEWRDTLTYIAPDGRAVRDLDMDEFGALPDCTRSRPDGFAVCGEYRINGNTLSFRSSGDYEEDDWSDPEVFVEKGDGFQMGDVEFTPLQPMDPALLAGAWVAESYTGSGPGMLGGVGSYSDAEVFWNFASDGRFEWHQSITNTTLISPSPILDADGNSIMGVSGGGSSTSTDGGSGSYTFADGWLDLSFDDGRHKRFFVMHSSTTNDTINLAGNNLRRG